MTVFVVSAASAQAATYLVATDGTDTGDCTVDPCETVQYAIEQHRFTPDPDDIIDVGAGAFPGNVAADQPEDDGLTIRGTLTGATRDTTLTGQGAGANDFDTAVLLGSCFDSQVTLRDLNVDTQPTGPDPANSNVRAIDLEGGSDLFNVHASNQQNSDAFSVVDVCQDGSRIVGSTIDATDTSGVDAIFTFDGVKIRSSDILLDDGSGAGIRQVFPGSVDPVNVTQTWIENGPGNPNPAVESSGDLTLDSSLITGGAAGAAIDASCVCGSGDIAWRVQNTTIDVGAPGTYDSALPDLLVLTDGPDPEIDVTVDSSILAEEIANVDFTGDPTPGSTMTCTNVDVQQVFLQAMTDDCQIGSDDNVTTDPADQFEGGSPFDWSLRAGAPAIDTGQAGGVPPGFSQRDLAGNKRRAPGTSATCPAGVLDKGAYERPGVPCLIEAPAIKDPASPEVGVTLFATRGTWTGEPTDFRWQWRRCNGGGPAPACEDIGPFRRTPGYTPVAADVGKRLRVRVKAENASGVSKPSAVSAPTARVGDGG